MTTRNFQPWRCDQCQCTPCETRSLCARFRQVEKDLAEQKRREANEGRYARPPDPAKPTFAQSTIDATRWLQKNAPERLPEWYRERPGLDRFMREFDHEQQPESEFAK